MKITAVALLAAVSGASAFTAPSFTASSSTAIRMSETTEEPEPVPDMSKSMPFMARPVALTGELAGDVGFDPIGFSSTRDELMSYREAEVKHARLAMLAAAGWPISELFDKKIAAVLGVSDALVGDRAPSLLNGGVEKISPFYWVAVFGVAAAVDFYGLSRRNEEGYFPGNLGFDPLGAYPKSKDGQEWMQTAEIKNGRLAMIAITAFAAQEAVTKLGIVDETPLFFKPLGETLREYANSGYV